MMRTVLAFAFSGALFSVFGQTPCENLKSLTLPNVTFTTVESVPAGPFRPPQPPGRGNCGSRAGRPRRGPTSDASRVLPCGHGSDAILRLAY